MGIAIPRDEEDTARGTAATREESAAKIRAMGMYISDGTLARGTLGNLTSVREMDRNVGEYLGCASGPYNRGGDCC